MVVRLNDNTDMRIIFVEFAKNHCLVKSWGILTLVFTGKRLYTGPNADIIKLWIDI